MKRSSPKRILADERGTLYEIPILVMLIGVVLAVVIPPLAKGDWRRALLGVGAVAGFVAGAVVLLAILGSLPGLPLSWTESRWWKRSCGAAAHVLIFLVCGGAAGFGTMFVLVLFFESLGAAAISTISSVIGLGCAVAATIAYWRARSAKEAAR
ncbi:MAG: hypothetical protein NTX64_08630 [Elusimicrobia bacterium]|nr:hypothetical protein [Elusimicrobiota bacterium]